MVMDEVLKTCAYSNPMNLFISVKITKKQEMGIKDTCNDIQSTLRYNNYKFKSTHQ